MRRVADREQLGREDVEPRHRWATVARHAQSQGGRVTHAPGRVPGRGAPRGPAPARRRSARGARASGGRMLLRLLLLTVLGGLALTLAPGAASAQTEEPAATEQVSGTLRTNLSGPIEGVEVVVTTEIGRASCRERV